MDALFPPFVRSDQKQEPVPVCWWIVERASQDESWARDAIEWLEDNNLSTQAKLVRKLTSGNPVALPASTDVQGAFQLCLKYKCNTDEMGPPERLVNRPKPTQGRKTKPQPPSNVDGSKKHEPPAAALARRREMARKLIKGDYGVCVLNMTRDVWVAKLRSDRDEIAAAGMYKTSVAAGLRELHRAPFAETEGRTITAAAVLSATRVVVGVSDASLRVYDCVDHKWVQKCSVLGVDVRALRAMGANRFAAVLRCKSLWVYDTAADGKINRSQHLSTCPIDDGHPPTFKALASAGATRLVAIAGHRAWCFYKRKSGGTFKLEVRVNYNLHTEPTIDTIAAVECIAPDGLVVATSKGYVFKTSTLRREAAVVVYKYDAPSGVSNAATCRTLEKGSYTCILEKRSYTCSDAVGWSDDVESDFTDVAYTVEERVADCKRVALHCLQYDPASRRCYVGCNTFACALPGLGSGPTAKLDVPGVVVATGITKLPGSKGGGSGWVAYAASKPQGVPMHSLSIQFLPNDKQTRRPAVATDCHCVAQAGEWLLAVSRKWVARMALHGGAAAGGEVQPAPAAAAPTAQAAAGLERPTAEAAAGVELSEAAQEVCTLPSYECYRYRRLEKKGCHKIERIQWSSHKGAPACCRVSFADDSKKHEDEFCIVRVVDNPQREYEKNDLSVFRDACSKSDFEDTGKWWGVYLKRDSVQEFNGKNYKVCVLTGQLKKNKNN